MESLILKINYFTRNKEERNIKMAKDPVCGMHVDEDKFYEISEYQNKKYYFCSPDCKAAFDKEPDKYVAPGKQNSDDQQ